MQRLESDQGLSDHTNRLASTISKDSTGGNKVEEQRILSEIKRKTTSSQVLSLKRTNAAEYEGSSQPLLRSLQNPGGPTTTSNVPPMPPPGWPEQRPESPLEPKLRRSSSSSSDESEKLGPKTESMIWNGDSSIPPDWAPTWKMMLKEDEDFRHQTTSEMSN